jgi:hypothetical protein
VLKCRTKASETGRASLLTESGPPKTRHLDFLKHEAVIEIPGNEGSNRVTLWPEFTPLRRGWI